MQTPAPSTPNLTGLHILVVEDEPLLAFDYVDELEERGATPLLALNLKEAVAAVERGLPDLAILDVNLGAETSWPVAATLSSKCVPFVLVSGYAMASSVPPGITPADCLEKPVGAHAVADRLASLVA